MSRKIFRKVVKEYLKSDYFSLTPNSSEDGFYKWETDTCCGYVGIFNKGVIVSLLNDSGYELVVDTGERKRQVKKMLENCYDPDVIEKVKHLLEQEK